MIALVMCGGKATRMGAGVEKPLLRVQGIPLVQRVVSALSSSQMFERIVAAVSPNTRMARQILESGGCEISDTSGEGYSVDLYSMLATLKPARVMSVPADIPLLNKEVVAEIAAIAQKGPAVSVVIESEFVKSLGIKPSVELIIEGLKYCHSGITIFESSRITGRVPAREHYVVMNRPEIAVNINTADELLIAEKLLIQRA